ncbi:MAG: hypothetical protein J6V44_15745 [Methanobrevibacter sp.]|nr:hypothetical protein [Methanobrevibacter sp.]
MKGWYCMSENVKKPDETLEEIIFCNRCGKPLRSDLSKKLGYGPSCYRMWKKERSQQHQLFDIGGDIKNG